MSDFSNIIEEINTNLPDNTTQSITAKKLRDTLIDLTNTIEEQQDNFEETVNDEMKFKTEEILNDVSIDDTHLVNPPTGTTLPLTEDILDIKASLGDVYVEESKADNGRLLSGYVNGETGAIGSTYSHFKINVKGHKRARFLGQSIALTSSLGYAFLNDSNAVVPGSPAYFPNNSTTGGSNAPVEIIAEIPEDAWYLITSAGTIHIPESNFYCYVQDGENIVDKMEDWRTYVDDTLHSSSAEHALSAKQGKILKDALDEVEEQIWYWEGNQIDTSNFLSLGIRGSMNLDNTWNVATSPNTYARHYAIPVEPGQKVTIKSNSENPCYYAFFTNEYDNTSVPTNGDPLPLVNGYYRMSMYANTETTYFVPEGAAWLCFNTGSTGQYVPAKITVYSKTDSKLIFEAEIVNNANSYDENVPLSANQGRILGEKLKDISINESKIASYTVENGYISGKTGNIGSPDSDTYKHAVISLTDDMFKLRFYGQTIGTQVVTGSAFYDEEGNFMIGYVFPERTGSENEPTEITLNIPYRAKTFKTTIQTTLIDAADFYCYATAGLTISDKVYEGASRYVTLSSTYIYNDGHTSSSTYYRTTSPIYGGHGFYLELNEDYRIYKVSLFDIKGNIVDPTYIPPTLGIPTYSLSTTTWKGRTWFSTLCILPQFYVKITIKRYDEARMTEEETPYIIKEFCYLDDPRLKRETFDEPWFYAVKNRLLQLSNVMLDPKKKIIASEVAANASEPGSTNDYFFYPGKLRNGVPYSEAIQYSKLVGMQVSIYTYLTALNNKNSLMYTESLYNNESGYGITYAGGSIHYYTSYFGIVCTALTGFALGIPTFYHTEFYTVEGTDEGIDGIENVPILSGSTAFDEAEIYDIIWYNGHCSIVSDIIYDEYGRRKYIVWAESLRPTPFITAYNKEQFNARISRSSCRLYRYDKTKITTESTSDSEYVQTEWQDYPIRIKYNNEICTFAGDKATFTEGDTIYINVNRQNKYTALDIFKDDSVSPTYTIDIQNISRNSDLDDWVNVNLTTYNLAYGKYKARARNQSEATDYTYFEVVKIELSYTIDGDDTTISFSTQGCTPVSVNCCSSIGYSKYIHVLTDEEKLAGSTTRSWNYTYNDRQKYIRLIAKGDYGNAAIKNIAIS